MAINVSLDIPNIWDVDDKEALKRDLQRLSSAVRKFVSEAPLKFAPRLTVSSINPDSATFGTLNRVSPLTNTTVVTLRLPGANTKNGGLTLAIERLVTGGGVILVPPGGVLINGMTSIGLSSAVGITLVYFDGQNYYIHGNPEVNWAGGTSA